MPGSIVFGTDTHNHIILSQAAASRHQPDDGADGRYEKDRGGWGKKHREIQMKETSIDECRKNKTGLS